MLPACVCQVGRAQACPGARLGVSLWFVVNSLFVAINCTTNISVICVAINDIIDVAITCMVVEITVLAVDTMVDFRRCCYLCYCY